MRKQILLADTSGKTIQSVIEGYDDILIVYTDGAFSFLHPTTGYSETAVIGEPNFFANWGSNCITNEDLVEHGFLTKVEIKALDDERDKKWKRDCDRQEREEYERLKAKYEGGKF